MESYYTVCSTTENVTVIERSKFICYIKGIQNEEEAKEFISQIRKLNSLATHNCYAYIADDKGLNQKFSDDGEPQGTAGLPMLNVLKNKKLYKTVAVVTRYFGGIKLGTGGLARAYSGAVADCLKVAQIGFVRPCVFNDFVVDYAKGNALLNILNKMDVKVISTEFDSQVRVKTVFIENVERDFESYKKKVVDLMGGQVTVENVERSFYADKVEL